MTLLIILGLVFACVALMVVVGEKYAKPMDEQEQAKYAKWLPILVIISIVILLIRTMLE